MPEEIAYEKAPRQKTSFLRGIFRTTAALFGAFKKNVGIALNDADVFLGTVFLAIGFLGFESDKYCDGNTADYLSCTRPSTYYYYDAIDITLVILGAFFVIVWFLKQREKRRS